MSFRLSMRSAVFALVLSSAASPALAVDGVILIDQARAIAGNVTQGDSPGFPVSLTQPGSYRLSSNLFVPANAAGISIAATGVTLDLNGFHIRGTGAGTGIVSPAAHRGTTIRNGSISSFARGIDLNGTNNEVQGIRAYDNSWAGIEVAGWSLVAGNIAMENGRGIVVDQSTVVRDNVAVFNRENGLEVGENSVLRGNALNNNNVGLALSCPSSLASNVANFNATQDVVLVFGSGCTGDLNIPGPRP